MPRVEKAFSVPLAGLKTGRPNPVSFGAFEFLIRPEEDGGYCVWNGVCPHEGAPLGEGAVCGEEIVCRWHGLKFRCVRLSPRAPRAALGPLAMSLQDGELKVGPS
ncbi:MAG: Rieske 2Fe-2S domain-containing protein [Elusimicrobia bacterium]|nr:Rieske 2Fe-2S domain-containing protein [Elusimicrobiota bacterium]